MQGVRGNVGLWETRRAGDVARRAKWRLAEAGLTEAAEVMAALHDWALPLLQRGRHMNPVHHTAVVADLMAEILLAEFSAGRVDADRVKLGIAAAVLHDAGNAFEPQDEEKVTTEAALADPEKAILARAQRVRHMDSGALLVEAALRADAMQHRFSEDEIGQVRTLVQNHDAPTLAASASEEHDCRRCLFASGDTPPLTAPPAAILREADRLWMLTVDGVVADLVRKIRDGKSWDPTSQLEHNVKRHREEGAMYGALFPAETRAAWGMEPGMAFYRTEGGKRLFRELQEHAGAVPVREWVERVMGIWLMTA